MTLKLYLFIPADEKYKCRIFIHALLSLPNMNKDILSVAIDIIKQELKLLKLWIRIQQYIATDFPGWLKMTSILKLRISPFLEASFEKFFHSNICITTLTNLK